MNVNLADRPLVKERPILFSGSMVQAILAGAKTQTRRIIKGAPEEAGLAMTSRPWSTPGLTEALFFAGPTPESRGLTSVRCPYGTVGDHLWVRETFYCNDFFYPEGQREQLLEEMYYRADGIPDFEGEEKDMQWRPSIHMPRWASRISLEITEIRVERLQSISEVDAIDEGVTTLGKEWLRPLMPEYVAEAERIEAEHQALQAQGQRFGYPRGPLGPSPKQRYQLLWNQINGEGAWDANPFVWAVSFKRVEP